MDCCRIYEQDSKARSTHYKSVNERKGKHPFCGNPYVAPTDKGKQRANFDRRPSGGGMYNPPRCFKCGDLGHRVAECRKDMRKCSNYGMIGHVAVDCKRNVMKCFNCGEPGHISAECPKPKKAQSGRQAN